MRRLKQFLCGIFGHGESWHIIPINRTEILEEDHGKTIYSQNDNNS